MPVPAPAPSAPAPATSAPAPSSRSQEQLAGSGSGTTLTRRSAPDSASGDLGGWLGIPVTGAPTTGGLDAVGWADAAAVHLRQGGRLTTLTRAGLADRVRDTASRMAGERRLVHVRGVNTLGTLVGYLAAHAAGHAVLLTPPGGPGDAIARAWDPDLVVDEAGDVAVLRTTPRQPLHPDLALLMSTSGSTGSPRLVRLSWDNLRSNAEAIAASLSIRPTDRAVTSLPVHYCYGLSVVHSHLVAGASVVLTDLSVADSCFWDLARDTAVTTLAGVPHSFELLDRVGFAGMDLPHLRTVTQAGGRLDPQRVVELAELGRTKGFDLVVMYGQTEATARMSTLAADLTATHPHTVGRPLEGARVDLVDGEIVYSGPNVMLGYAETPADLALGRTVDRLHTGDLGRWTPEGLLEVTGRRSRVAKVLGHRVDLDHVERGLRADGCDVRCVDGGAGLVVCAAGAPAGDLASAAARRAGLPTRCVRVLGPHDLGLDALPHLPSGKVDYATLAALAAAAHDRDAAPLAGSLRERYAVLLGRDVVSPDDSFSSLGGDSLSYVEASLHVEERLGTLPTGWHVMPLGDLEELEGAARQTRADADGTASARPTGGWVRRATDRWLTTRSLETGVVLRAVAIVLIVGTHAHVFRLQGTAHALLVLVGYNLARFTLGAGDRATRVRALLTALRRVAAPALVVIGAVHVATGQYALSTIGLLNWVFGEPRLGPDWRFWFIESTVVVVVVVMAVVATPWGDRLERRHPFALPLALAGLGMLWWKDLLYPPVPHMQGSPLVVAWLFFLGWAAARADGVRERLVVTAVAIPSIGTFSGNPRRDLLTLAAALLVLWVPTLRVPRALVPVVHVLAASSLFVYVVHWQVLQAMRATPWLSVAVGLVVGILYRLAWTGGPAAVRRWSRGVRRLRGQDRADAGHAPTAVTAGLRPGPASAR